MASTSRPLAVATGASSGIGYELARICAQNGYDLIVAADEAQIDRAATEFESLGASVTAIEADLSTFEGVDELYEAIGGRKVDALLANAGRGLGGGFLEQDVASWKKVIDTNITGTVYLVQKVAGDMAEPGTAKKSA